MYIYIYMYNLKNVKNTHVGELLLLKLQAEPTTLLKVKTHPRVFFTFFKLYK